ncbi:MAG: hypothetical protein WCQ72_08110 [Eubacteriales bacterium]
MDNKFLISFWNTQDIDDASANEADMWHDLGITVAMSPSCGEGDEEKLTAILDGAQKYGIKVIICDKRANWHSYERLGDAEYRKLFARLNDAYGAHPAVYGFFVGDEPNAPDFEAALAVVRIQNEIAPQLTAYLNLLPWFDWIAERMGTPALAPYLDRAVNESGTKILSYDCYAQMWGSDEGLDVYFNNLREYYENVKRNNVPFVNIILSCGHYNYRTPSKNDMQWQLGTSVAMGARGISWFFVTLPGIWDNYRNAPINQLGERTESFAWLSEVNRVFQNYVGTLMSTLTIDACYHVGRAYGGVAMFEPFGNLLSVSSSDESVPLIASRFHDNAGGEYYVVCVNSPEKSAYVSMSFTEGLKLSRSVYGGKFAPVTSHTDPIGALDRKEGQSAGVWLAPGQLVVIRAEK